MPKISLNELSIVFNKIIEKLEFEELSEIVIYDNFYKFIPTDEWATFEKDVIETGSLFDDIEGLKKLVLDKNRPCTYVDFDRLASLLRAISQTNNPV